MTTEKKLDDLVLSTVYDPLRFVKLMYPWGEKGVLARHQGPDAWQETLLRELGEQLKAGKSPRISTTSGHGVGKSALVAWIVHWFISTRPHPQIVVTANTRDQLLKKTFRELAVWHKRALNKHWFTWTATKFYRNTHPETWFAAAVAWSAENPEAFAGTHAEHVLMVFDEACHDDQTEVMTDHGWKRFSALDGTERLLTMDPDTKRCFYERPTKLFVSPHRGEMWEYTHRGANFCVTPNHKMLEQRYSPKRDGSPEYTDWQLTPLNQIVAQQFYVPKGIHARDETTKTHFTLPTYKGARKQWGELRIPMNEWMVFLGWYFSEGSLNYLPNSGLVNRVTITQKNVAPLRALQSMAASWGCATSLYTSNTTPQLQIRHGGLAAYLHNCGRGCRIKRFPPEVRQATCKQQELFLRAFCEGDGYYQSPKRMILYTSNEGLAADLQEIALLAGFNSTVTKRPLAGVTSQLPTHLATSTVDGFAVSVVSDGFPRAKIRQKHIQKIQYDGLVYCAEVPSHHTLLTRRNGVAMWSGNSGIDDVIWEYTEGAMTTDQAAWLVFGNPTRNTGRFRECFGRFSHRWTPFKVDSRTAKMTNKAQLQQWIDDYGDDSDFVRVRVKGEFPRAGSTQFIPSDLVERAVRNPVPDDPGAPKIIGADVARFGDDQSVILRRHGNKVLPINAYRGLDLMTFAALIAEEIERWEPDAVFVDGTGLGGGVVDRLRQLNYRVVDVISAAKADDEAKYANKRAEMWGRMRDWLKGDVALPAHQGLMDGLIGLEYGFGTKMALQLEKKSDMKARGLDSPDEADALALTFAEPTRSRESRLILPEYYGRARIKARREETDWRLL